jgi:hypothetical protein
LVELQGLGVGNQGHGAVWISLDGARSSPFLAEFIDAPAISSKSALVIILAKAKGKMICPRSAARSNTRGPWLHHAYSEAQMCLKKCLAQFEI